MKDSDSRAEVVDPGDQTVATVLIGGMDDGSTVQDQGPNAEPGTGTSGTTSDTGSLTTVASPQDAMLLQEVERIRSFMLFSSLMCLLVAVLVPVLGKDGVATWFLVGTSASTAVTAFVFVRLFKDPSRYRPWMGTLFSMIAANAVIAGFYFFGITSAVLMIVPLGAYLLALGENIRAALASHVYISLGHLLLSVLQIVGAVPEVGLIRLYENSTAERIGVAIATQVVLLATFIMARAVRKTTVETLTQLNAEITDNARRAALLDEAKQELALARKVGGAGRFTEHVFGSFRLGEILGRGAMGEIYAGSHVDSGDLAAVKMLSFDAMRQPDLVARFLREMKMAQSLRHENVVAVLEISGEDDEIPFFVMERLAGISLSDKLRDVGTMSLPECTELISAVVLGIEAAHGLGIIHRDLKPSNLFLHERDGRHTWKVLDFGVSKFMDEGDTLTAGAIVGTPSYMSPEQARGESVTVRSDVYSLGVVAYRVLTGRPAFGGAELPIVLHAVVYDMPPCPSELADVSACVDTVLAIAMAKDPARRFSTPAKFAAALEAAGSGTLHPALEKRGRRLVAAWPWGVASL